MSLPLGHPQVWGRLFYCVCSHSTVYSSLKVLFIPQLIVSLLFSPFISCEDRYCPFCWALCLAPHSSTLAWKIPWTEEPGGLQSMGSLRVGHYWATSLFTFHALEKEMATHSSVLAWRIPGMGELSGLLSMGSHRVGHDWSDLAAACLAQRIY